MKQGTSQFKANEKRLNKKQKGLMTIHLRSSKENVRMH